MSEQALYELKVVEGKDAGKAVPLEGDTITLGRSGAGFELNPGEIHFEEPSVSRVHAVLIWNAKERVYHVSNRSPISPIQINGTPAAHGRLAAGARLHMGRLVVEMNALTDDVPDLEVEIKPAVAENAGFLGEYTPPPAAEVVKPAWLLNRDAPAAAPAATAAEDGKKPASGGKKKKDEPAAGGSKTPALRGFLVVMKGAEKGTRYPVYETPTTIGRSPECTVNLPDQQVSRLHCAIEWDQGVPTVVHQSSTSSTKIGRTNVKDRQDLKSDDEITLADKIVLKWERM